MTIVNLGAGLTSAEFSFFSACFNFSDFIKM